MGAGRSDAGVGTLTESLIPPFSDERRDLEWEAGLLADEMEREAGRFSKQTNGIAEPLGNNHNAPPGLTGTAAVDGQLPAAKPEVEGTIEAAHKPRGGRKPKWDDLVQLDEEMHAEDSNVLDKDVVKKYNAKYAGPIAKGHRKRATVDALREARRYRKNRESSETHKG